MIEFAQHNDVQKYIGWMDKGEYKDLSSYVWSDSKSNKFSLTSLKSYERLFSIKVYNGNYSVEEVELLKLFIIKLKQKIMSKSKRYITY